ncbi:MAG TPA: hypothetical protein PLK94_07615 [Alphaproteobacteria bacterium]|nr:hypothetical protein [Alphaproteobacteria bacterium]
MNKVIVTTTIQSPTRAIEKFDSLQGWTLVVAGDLKTPKDYKLTNGIYLSPKDQEKRCKELSDAIGWNNHARRNFGNIWARDLDADIIAVVDDDNIPLDGWGENLLVGKEAEVNFYKPAADAFDPVGATNYPQLWHRGYPLQLLSHREYEDCSRKNITPDIQADFWNGDPDVDAMCRMIYSPECKFKEEYFPMASCKPAPFNSQNIFISKTALADYFVLPHVSPRGRMGDIWISYHMQSLGYKVVFCAPSVYQARNPHDLTVDMIDEYIGYENNHHIVRSIVNGDYSIEQFWPESTRYAYNIYRKMF